MNEPSTSLSWTTRIAVAAALYALVVGGLLAYAAFGPVAHGEWIGGWLDVDDQLFFLPVVVLVALVSGVLGLRHGRANKRWALFALGISLVGLAGAGLVVTMLLSGASLLDNL